MLALDIRGDMRAIALDFRKVRKQLVPAVFKDSANRALISVRAKATKDIAASKQIKAKLIRGRFAIRKATKKRQRATIWFKHWRMPVSIVGRARETRRGVSVGKHKIAGAFIAAGRRADTVFKRVDGVARGPLVEQVIKLEPEGSAITGATFRRIGRARFRKEFRQRLAFRLRVK